MKYLVLIIAVLLAIAPSCQWFLPRNSASGEVNATIVNSTKAIIEPSEEAVLEQRLADVL
jgi:hypothetical protein